MQKFVQESDVDALLERYREALFKIKSLEFTAATRREWCVRMEEEIESLRSKRSEEEARILQVNDMLWRENGRLENEKAVLAESLDCVRDGVATLHDEHTTTCGILLDKIRAYEAEKLSDGMYVQPDKFTDVRSSHTRHLSGDRYVTVFVLSDCVGVEICSPGSTLRFALTQEAAATLYALLGDD
jgi:hypothetical protein